MDDANGTSARAAAGSGVVITLRGILRLSIGFLAILLLVASVALAFVTARLHDAASEAATAIESMRVAETLQLELTTLHRSVALATVSGQPAESAATRALETRLERLLVEARRYAPTEPERALVDRVEHAIEEYFDELRQGSARGAERVLSLGRKYDRAFDALASLVRFNVDLGRALGVRAADWNRLADALSLAVVIFSVMGIVALTFALQREVYRPLHALHAVVQRFTGGVTDVRAEERGVKEVREIGRSFNEMTDKLNRQEHDRISFLSGLAQDLRDPLTVIRILTAERDADPANALAGITRQARRIERILRDVVDGALIASGKLDLRVAPHDLTLSAKEAAAAARPLAPDHRIDVEVPDQPIVATVDATRVEHVLANLISNAIKFSPAGSRVTVRVGERDGGVELSVSDEGIGIKPEERARIFEPSSRTGISPGDISGTGLGLSATKRIVEAHGGTIEVESAPSVGSTFRVTLPRGPRAGGAS